MAQDWCVCKYRQLYKNEIDISDEMRRLIESMTHLKYLTLQGKYNNSPRLHRVLVSEFDYKNENIVYRVVRETLMSEGATPEMILKISELFTKALDGILEVMTDTSRDVEKYILDEFKAVPARDEIRKAVLFEIDEAVKLMRDSIFSVKNNAVFKCLMEKCIDLIMDNTVYATVSADDYDCKQREHFAYMSYLAGRCLEAARLLGDYDKVQDNAFIELIIRKLYGETLPHIIKIIKEREPKDKSSKRQDIIDEKNPRDAGDALRKKKRLDDIDFVSVCHFGLPSIASLSDKELKLLKLIVSYIL